MIAIEYTKKLDSTIKQRNILFLCLIASFIVLTLLIIILVTKSRTVILVPSNLQTEMRLSTDGKASKTYIEQFARDIMHTMLNVTPSSIKYASKSILKISSPKLHKTLSHQFAVYEKDVINKNISTYFSLHTITFPTEDNLSVLTEGEMITFIGKDIVSKQNRKYKLRFELNGTKIFLIGFNEVEELSNLQLEAITEEQYEEDLRKAKEDDHFIEMEDDL
jgi:type IV conjugative transfer system protein TraE